MKKHIYSSRDPSLWITCGLILMVLAVYGYSIGFDFVHFDDNVYVSENPNVQKGLTRESVEWAFTTAYANFWHPLTWLSLMLDRQLWGPGPFGHHFFSMIFHAINAVLLFWSLRAMTKDCWKSALVSAFFAVHPLHVESVVWIAQRKDVLSGFFWIFTLWSYTRYVKRSGVYAYIMVVFLFILGLMAKPMGVTLPFVLLLLDHWPLKRHEPFRKLFLEKTPLLLISAVACVVAFMAQKAGGAIVSVEDLSFLARFMNGLISYVTYIWKTLCPFHLAVFYPWPVHISWWQALGAGAILSAITVVTALNRRTHPYLVVGWLWFLGTLVPVIGLVKVGEFSMADRYAYIPLIGLYIMLVWGGHDLMVKWFPAGRYRAVFVAILLFLFAWRAGNQTTYWKDGITLFEHALQVTRSNYVAHNNLSVLFLERGALDKAEEHLNRALEIKPSSDEAHHNMGTLLTRRGEMDKALNHYYRAIEINSENSDSHYNLAGIYERKGRFAEAASHYKKVVKILSHDWEARHHLSECLIQTGHVREALEVIQTTIRFNPHNSEAQEDLKKLLDVMEELKKEIQRLKKEQDTDSENVERYVQLGDLLEAVGSPAESILYYERALALEPNHLGSLNGLALACVETKAYDTALASLKKLSILSPDQAGIDYNISCVYAKAQRPEESMEWLKRAVQKGYDNWDRIRSDEDLDAIRKKPEFESLMKTYFPGREPEG
ncbi:MAG: tetratricopeptide repeat protein [Proteobacteria bacterium]|nr:tetratricopeptide repeat protein [Pseudomonadota bacterium]